MAAIDPRLTMDIPLHVRPDSGNEPSPKVVTTSPPSDTISNISVSAQITEPSLPVDNCSHRVLHHSLPLPCQHGIQNHQGCPFPPVSWCRAVATTACIHCFRENRLCLVLIDSENKMTGKCETCEAHWVNEIKKKARCNASYHPHMDDKPTKLINPPKQMPGNDTDNPLNRLNENRETNPVLLSFARQLSYDEEVLDQENRRLCNEDGSQSESSLKRSRMVDYMRMNTMRAREAYFRTGEWVGGTTHSDFVFD